MDRDYARRGMGCASIYGRAKNDLYTTDSKAIDLLVKNGYVTNKEIPLWECACGDGALSERLKHYGFTVYSTDLYDYGYGESNVDFIRCNKNKYGADIITNPPFSLLQEFILNGLKLTNGRLYIFSRLQTLESIKRYEHIYRNHPPMCVLPFVKRIPCYKNGDKSRGSSVTPYAWFIWDKNYDGKPFIDWLI